MNIRKYFLVIVLTSIISILVYVQFVQLRTNVLGYVRYQVEQTEKGYSPIDISAFGILKLTKNQPKSLNQLFKIDLLNNKVILSEGLINENGSIIMSSIKILDIISVTKTETIVKDDVWTITVTKNSVTLIDKEGRVGSLISGLSGSLERDLLSY